MEVGRSRNQLQKSSSANGPLVPFPSLDSKEGSLSLAAIRQQLRPVLTSRSKTIETNIVQDSSSLYKREHLFSTPPLPNRAPPAIPGTSSDTPLPSCLRLQRVNHFPGPNPTPGGLRLHHSTSKSSPIPIRTKHSIGNVDISRGPLDRGPTQNLQATATAPRNPAACASPSSISSSSSELTVSTPRPVLQESQEESTYYVNSPVSISSTNPDRVGLRGTITWYDGATMNRDFDEIIKNHLDGKLAGFLNTTRGIFIRIGFCLFADDYVEDLHGDQRIFETVDSMLDEVSTGLRTIEVGLRRLLGRCKLAKGSLPPIESLRESQTSDEVYLWGKLNIW
ncbi:MAG: hypothetical protein M1824_000501 [Vezdaea acicularis]|nr:MAG: hypothetical protein M1824_000501 [Vezdaea acicularis]